MPNVEALARNVASAIEHAGKAMAAYMRPREAGEIKTTIADDVGDLVRSLGHRGITCPIPRRPSRRRSTIRIIDLWAATLQRFQGAPVKSVAEPDGSDKRYPDAEWRDNPFFDFLKQAYVVTSDWADDLVRRADELEPRKRDKARFYLRQVTAALSPSNFGPRMPNCCEPPSPRAARISRGASRCWPRTSTPDVATCASARWTRAEGGDRTGHIAGEALETIGLDLVGFVGAAVAANVDRTSREAGACDGGHLVAPGVPRLRKAVDHDHQRALTLEGDPQGDLAHWNRRKSDMTLPPALCRPARQPIQDQPAPANASPDPSLSGMTLRMYASLRRHQHDDHHPDRQAQIER